MSATAVENLEIYFTGVANSGILNAEPDNLSNQHTAEEKAKQESRRKTIVVYKRLLLDVHEVCIYHHGKRYSAEPPTK